MSPFLYNLYTDLLLDFQLQILNNFKLFQRGKPYCQSRYLSFYYYNYPDSQNQISVTIYLHNFDLHNLR